MSWVHARFNRAAALSQRGIFAPRRDDRLEAARRRIVAATLKVEIGEPIFDLPVTRMRGADVFVRRLSVAPSVLDGEPIRGNQLGVDRAFVRGAARGSR